MFRRLEEEQLSKFNRYTILSKKIPKQVPKGLVNEIAMKALSVVVDVSKIALVGSFLASFFIQGYLS